MNNMMTFDTLMDVYSYIDSKNIKKYKISLCKYPNAAFYLVEW